MRGHAESEAPSEFRDERNIEVTLGIPSNGKDNEVNGAHEAIFFTYIDPNLKGNYKKEMTLDISLRRTVRVPDNDKSYDLPPDAGAFPIYSIKQHGRRLPQEVRDQGGCFIPIYQSEAMWIDFNSEWPFAVKIYVGGINAVSGESQQENMATTFRRKSAVARGKSIQDYIVAGHHQQEWLDGIAKTDGKIMQFVATPMGSGYSVESQITGADTVGGLQFDITPLRADMMTITFTNHGSSEENQNQKFYVSLTTKFDGIIAQYCSRTKQRRNKLRFAFERNDEVHWISANDSMEMVGIKDGSVIDVYLEQLGGAPPERANSLLAAAEVEDQPQLQMALAAGGRINQTIFADPYDASDWDTDSSVVCSVQLINASVFEAVTGFQPPPTPITAEQYAAEGLPFYKIFEEPGGVSGKFGKVKSLAQIAIDEGRGTRSRKHREEKKLKFPTLDVSKFLTSSFVPVAVLEKRLKKIRVAQDL